MAAIAAPVALCALVAGGCDCEKHRAAMERIADKGFEDAFQCCRALAETNPPEGEVCFQSLREWRTELTTLIVQWYQACLDGNSELAGQLLHALRAIFVVRFDEASGATCSSVVLDPNGGYRTAGIALDRSDLVRIGGAFVGGLGPAGDIDRETRFVLRGGTFEAEVFGVSVAGALSGELRLAAAAAGGTRAVEDLSLVFATPLGALRCSLSPIDSAGALAANGGDALLHARVRLSADDAVALLLPSEAWIELPLIRSGVGYAIAPGTRAIREVVPPALGVADWVCDGHIGLDDWAAYFSAADRDRDLDLDGDADEEDDAIFIRSWRRAADE
ncbi:MAG: hypothetical protein U0572_10735 [Phycisphaerales bacterium]